MNQQDFVKKVNDRTLTVKEAFDHLLTRPDVKDAIDPKTKKKTTSTFDQIRGLRDNIDFDLNKPFFEVYNTKEFSEALAVPTNRFKEMSRFETIFKKALVDTDFKASDLEKISGAGGKADAFGLGGVQNRGKDPMRGTILSKDFDSIFDKAIKNAKIDEGTRLFAIYEKYTGQRVDSVVGKFGLKLSDLTPGVDAQTGQVYVDVAGKFSATKTRPTVRYTDEFAEFLIDTLNKAKEKAGPNAKFTEINLFQTTKTKMDDFWNTNIRPELEKKFEAQLPLNKETGRGFATPKVLRKIIARQLVDEFKVSKELVKSWMGHAGAGVSVSGDILEDNYTGVIPDDRIGALSNNLIRNDGYNISRGGTVNNLFKSRKVTIDSFKPESNKAYLSFTKPYAFNDGNVAGQKPVVMSMTASQKKLYAQLDQEQITVSKGRELEQQLKNLGLEKKALKERLKVAGKSEEVLVQEELAKLKKKEAKAKAKGIALEEKTPKDPTEFSEGLKAALKRNGIVIGALSTITKVAKSAPFIGGPIEYMESKQKGEPEEQARAKGLIGAISPITTGDIETAEKVVGAAAQPLVDEAKKSMQEQDVSFLGGIMSSFGYPTGGGFSSGGFISKKQSRR